MSVGKPRKPVPEGFATLLPTMGYNEARKHYRVNDKTLKRWMTEAGVVTKVFRGVVPPVAGRPVPDDFHQHAPHESTKQLQARYSIKHVSTIHRWRRETGILARRPNGQAKANDPKPATQTAVAGTPRGRWKVPTAAPVTGRDMSQVGLAAEELRRRGYVPVCRAKTIDPKASVDEWVVGRRRMNADDVLALAGWLVAA